MRETRQPSIPVLLVSEEYRIVPSRATSVDLGGSGFSFDRFCEACRQMRAAFYDAKREDAERDFGALGAPAGSRSVSE